MSTYNQITRYSAPLFFLIITIFLLGCFRNFYKVQQEEIGEFRESTVKDLEKYFVIHHQDVAMHISDITLSETTLEGELSALPPERSHFKTTKSEGVNRYLTKDKYVLEEVHIFVDPMASLQVKEGHLNLPLYTIREIQVYDYAAGATIASHVIPVVVVAAVTAAAILSVQNSGSSSPPKPKPKPQPQPNPQPTDGPYEGGSCPYIYSNNGQTFRLEGEVFSGAVFNSLERADYLPLPNIVPINDQYQIRISNELREVQHINMTKLIVVDHPKNSTVLLDQEGEAYTITTPMSPDQAITLSGSDMRSVVSEKDNVFYYFEDGGETEDTVELTFRKPLAAQTAKLVLNLKSSFWLDRLYGEFTKKLGFRYDRWVANQHKRPTEDHLAWIEEQSLPLSIDLQTPDGWNSVAKILTIGPLMARDIVVPLDLAGHTTDEVKINLRSGFMFWDLDYVAIDFTQDKDIESVEIDLESAISVDGELHADALMEDDEMYLHQIYTGDKVDVTFDAPSTKPGVQRSVFLHCKGYYEKLRDYRGVPAVSNLWKFNNPGYFSTFSKEQYEIFVNKNVLAN